MIFTLLLLNGFVQHFHVRVLPAVGKNKVVLFFHIAVWNSIACIQHGLSIVYLTTTGSFPVWSQYK